MIDQSFREGLAKVASPLIKLYRFFHLSPNTVTLIALGMAVAASYFCAHGDTIPALGLWWGGRLLDGTDGIYARATGRATPFGAYLDIVCDMAAYSAMILGFAYRFPQYGFYWSLILMGYVLCITSALAMGTLEGQLKIKPADNRGLRLAAGLAEGGETGITYTFMLLFPAYLMTEIYVWIAILFFTVAARTLIGLRYAHAKSSVA